MQRLAMAANELICKAGARWLQFRSRAFRFCASMHAPVAQWTERLRPKEGVGSSILSWGTSSF
jgi:hypothetical protein